MNYRWKVVEQLKAEVHFKCTQAIFPLLLNRETGNKGFMVIIPPLENILRSLLDSS